MAKYAYPAVFTQEENGLYSVNFPDFESCYTSGENIANALDMANDVLAFTLYDIEKTHKNIPNSSNPKSITVDDNSFISMILCDTDEYRKYYDSKAVKKTLTIPSWLNEKAIEQNINFSQALQETLMERLNI